jgi:DNA polymerase III subunit alpha
LEPTFGILIYQDDIMMLAVNFAGYSWGEADKFRKAMGKKIPEIMAQQKEKFSKGCIEVGGLSEKQVKALWESIETFAAYGFNKAHAASYGRIAYLTSYLKANFPVLYMSSVLTADSGDVDKIAIMIEECKRMGIDVLPPDINESFSEFAAIPPDPSSSKESKGNERIRFGLTTIKNFGEGISHVITAERKANGKFKSMEDFLTRITDRNLNKKSLEALIKAGAFDSLGDRASFLYNLENLLKFNKDLSKGDKNQDSLFGGTSTEVSHLHLEKTEPIPTEQKLAWEKELLGLYISGNPLDQYKELLEKRNQSISKIKKEKKIGGTHIVAGLVEWVHEISTKKGAKMAFVGIKDFDDLIECVFFPELYETYKELLTNEKCIAVKGKLNERNGELSILADKAKKLSN